MGSAEEAASREKVAEIAAGLRERLLNSLGMLAWLVGVPFMMLATAVEVWRGTWSRPTFILELMFIPLLAVVARSRVVPYRARVGITASLLLALSLLALINFGPNLGVGMVFAMASLICTFLVGAWGLVATISILGVGAGLVAYAGFSGWIVPHNPLMSPSDWARMGVTFVGINLILSAFLTMMERSMTQAVEAQAAAHQREQEADKQRARALESNLERERLQSLGQLAGGVAHDVNNALMAVQMWSEALALDLPAQSEQRSMLGHIQKAADRCTATVRQLVSFSKDHGASEEESCQVRELLPQLTKSIAAGIPESISLELQQDDSPFEVTIGGPQLEQALLNLIFNARDAMPDGGRLAVRVRHDPTTQEDIIEVQDDGVGMSAEVAERAFEPFFTTKDAAGTGLGLAMVWGTVTGAGGSVELATAPGEGSTVTLRLPTENAVRVSERRSRDGAPDASLEGMTALVIEDEPLVLRGLQVTLERLGMLPVLAKSVEEAELQLSQLKQVDLLLTDAVLPGGGAVDFIHRFRERYPNTPVLLCSGYLGDARWKNLLEQPAFSFLSKPFTMATLSKAVRDLLTSERAQAAIQ